MSGTERCPADEEVTKEIDAPKGYLTVNVPGGRVCIATDMIDIATDAPCVVVMVESRHEDSPDGDGRLWEVEKPRTYAKPGKVVMHSRTLESGT